MLTRDMYDEVRRHYPVGLMRSLQQWMRWVLPELRGFAGPKASSDDLMRFDEVVRRTLDAVDARADEPFETVVIQTLCTARFEYKPVENEL